VFLLIMALLFFCFLMILGGSGWFGVLLIFLILGFLTLLSMCAPPPNEIRVDESPHKDQEKIEEEFDEELDELEDLMDMGII
jgi:uncharacterized protein (DUF58 family)